MNRIIGKIGVIYLLVSIAWIHNVQSQTKTNIVTKEINKTFNILSQQKISIYAEKADVRITESKNDEFILNLKLISKNTDLEIAKEQLDYLKYVIKETKNEITVRNLIVIEKNKTLSGNIKAVYTLQIPKNATVSIRNSLGDIDILGLTGNYSLSVKYGNILIKNSSGNFNLNHQIGDLYISNCNLSCKINSENVTNNFQSNKGSYIFETNMGSLNFELNSDISVLAIKSIGTQLNFSNTSCNEFNWDIISESGTLYIKECNIKSSQKVLIDNRDKNLNKTEFKYKSDNSNRIQIINKYSNIFIN